MFTPTPPHLTLAAPSSSDTDIPYEQPRARIRVGLDFTQAGPRFVSYVKTLARDVASDTGGLRALDITLRARSSGVPERKLTFWFVDLEGTPAQIAEQVVLLVPKTQVFPEQYVTEIREPNHVHALATGITAWLVCRGEAVEYYKPTPDPDKDPPPTTPGTPVIDVDFGFRKAA